MAPGKGRKAPKGKPKGIGIDFKKVKRKVGRKLPPPKNETKLDFSTKSIVLPEQSVAQNKEGIALNLRRQSLKDLLTQSTHYSERIRKEALLGIKDLISRHPAELALHAVSILEKLSPRITDGDKAVRQAFILLIRSTIFPNLPQAKIGPLVPVVMAHLSSAMTHMTMDIRLTAFGLLDLLVLHYPATVVSVYAHEITGHYLDILGKGGVNKQASATVLKLLSSLQQFLTSLKIALSQGVEGTFSSGVHYWGEKYNLNMQGNSNKVSALHGYRSMVVKQGRDNIARLGFLLSSEQLGQTEDDSNARDVRNKLGRVIRNGGTTGNSSEKSTLLSSLVPVLLDCWAEFSPSVCAGPVPDSSNLSCMVCITRCLKLVLDVLINSSSEVLASARSLEMGGPHEEDTAKGRWMHKHLLPGFTHHLMASFPMTSSSVQLTDKVEEDVVALNVGICEVMLPFTTTHGAKTEKDQLACKKVLEYFRCALHGMILPSSELSSAVIDSKLAEPHVKSLLGYLPELIFCLSEEWVSELLETFTTQVFEKSRAQSALKLACLAVMVKMLLRQSNGGDGDKNKKHAVDIPFEVQRQWLQSLPRLLWELKHTHPSVSQAVLQMLLHIGQTAPEGSLLLEEYTALQPVMTPFFCTSLTSKNSQTRSIYGPFVKLPRNCQEVAADLLYYYKSFSPSFLKALAQCCLSPQVDTKVAMRIVEVLQRAFCKGAINLSDHLSFLLTLLVGHPSINSDSVLGKPEDVDQKSEQVTGKDVQQKQLVLGGVVCSCLTQLGDESLILQLLAPSLQQELTLPPSVDVEHAILRVISVLSQGGRQIPSTLREALPKLVGKLIRGVYEGGTAHLQHYSDSAKEFLLRLCMAVLSRDSRLAGQVVEDMAALVQEASTTSSFTTVYRAALKALLRCFEDKKVASLLRSSETVVLNIMQTRRFMVSDGAIQDTRDVEKLLLELEDVTATLYGWKLGQAVRMVQ